MRAFACLLTALALALPGAVGAQTIRGIVYEDTTSTGVAGAAIELLRLDGRSLQPTTTDQSGHFQLSVRGRGTYRVRVTDPFSSQQAADTVTVAASEVVRIQLRLSRTAVPLPPLEVIGRSRDPFMGFHARAERASFGRFVTRAELDARKGTPVTLLLAEEESAIRLIHVPRAEFGSSVRLVSMRSPAGRDCAPTIYLDGMPLQQFRDSPLDEILTPGNLEGVEIYNSQAGMPPGLYSRDNCGVIAFWTRSGTGTFAWKKAGIATAALVLVALLFR